MRRTVSPPNSLPRGGDLTVKTSLDARRRSSLAPPALVARLRGPGGLYSIGNLVALASGLAVQVARSTEAGGEGMNPVFNAARSYLIGSPGATALTVAILIFFASGEMYFRAVARGTAGSEGELVGRSALRNCGSGADNRACRLRRFHARASF